MDATEHNHNESEISPFQEICLQHGERINRQHGCPKCVMEEVRRHERRIHMPLELEAPLELQNDSPIELEHEAPIEIEHDVPIPAEPLGIVNPINIEVG